MCGQQQGQGRGHLLGDQDSWWPMTNAGEDIEEHMVVSWCSYGCGTGGQSGKHCFVLAIVILAKIHLG